MEEMDRRTRKIIEEVLAAREEGEKAEKTTVRGRGTMEASTSTPLNVLSGDYRRYHQAPIGIKDSTTFFLAWHIYMSIRITFQPERGPGLVNWTSILHYFIRLNYELLSSNTSLRIINVIRMHLQTISSIRILP